MTIETTFATRANSAMLRAGRDFTVTSKIAGLGMRSELRKLEVAETNATERALIAADKIGKVKKVAYAEPGDVPEAPKKYTKADLQAGISHTYIARRLRSGYEVFAGPFLLRGMLDSRTSMRKFQAANPTLDPRTLEFVRGRELAGTDKTVKFADTFKPRAVRTAPKTTDRRPKPVETAAQKAAAKKRQEAWNQRRLAGKATRMIKALSTPDYSKLYVIDDKRNRIVAGPFSKLADATKAAADVKNAVVLSGRQCRNESLKYATSFKANKEFKLTVGMFAVGVTVKLNGKRVKITAFDKAHKIVRTGYGDFFMVDCTFDPVANVIVAPNQK